MIRNESQYNTQGLYWNYWLNHWQIFNASPFENAIAFVTATPTISAITLHPTTADGVKVYNGNSVQFTVEATGTNNPPSKCTYAVSGNNSDGTYINTLGLLLVANDETAATLTVTATSTFDTNVSDSSDVTVVQAP